MEQLPSHVSARTVPPRYSVLSKFTAFVGVEKRTEAVEASMVRRRFIPVGLRSTNPPPLPGFEVLATSDFCAPGQRKVRTVMINGTSHATRTLRCTTTATTEVVRSSVCAQA
jgi:hypothetical protein